MPSPRFESGSATVKAMLFLGAVLVATWVLIEGAVFLIYRPPMPEPVETDLLADVDSVDVRSGREQAGLGFRDPSMVLHPYLGYVFLPKDRRPADNPGHPQISISEDGFLDKAPAVRKRGPNRVVIGVTGGSVAGQLGTWHPHHPQAALERVDMFRARELDFVWLGMPGYHQPQQAIQLIYILAQGGEFDYFINLDGFNELAVPAVLNEPQGAHPLFPMNWSMVALDVPDTELRRTIGAIDYLQTERSARSAAFATSPWRYSPTARRIRQRDDEKLAGQIGAYGWRLQEFLPDEVPYFVSGPDRLHVPTDEMLPQLVEIWKRTSLEMNAICEAAGVRYLHCLQPNQYDPGSKPLSAEEKEKAFDPEGPYRPVVEAGYSRLRAAGEELRHEGVAFYDLSDIFRDERETLYTDSCCHFNSEGNRIMADAIAGAVESSFGG